MRLLQYKELNLRRVKAAFDKVKAAIEAGDFRSADVKKLNAGPYYRAKLDYTNRLLLQFARIDRALADGGTETVCLALEVIENHAYDRSRFLRGAVVDENRIEREPAADAQAPALAAEATPLRWLGPGRTQFELLDKPIVFDEAQDEAYRHPAPLVVIGSAGSGKTAVTLARLREAEGRVLYVTLSAYLAQSARALHAALGFENPKQEVDFLSYRELLETLRVPPGREVSLPAFAGECLHVFHKLFELRLRHKDRIVAVGIEYTLGHGSFEFKHPEHALFYAVGGYHIDNRHVFGLSHAVDAAYTLFEHSRVPGHVEVDDHRSGLQVEAHTAGIG